MNDPNRRRRTRAAAAVASIAALAVLLAGIASREGSPQAGPTDAARRAQIARGKYLVTIGGCNDCHTPWIPQPGGKPGPDMSRSLSGHPQQAPISRHAELSDPSYGWAAAPTNTAFSGPWGVSFAANLTPDANTGTGTWTFDIFKSAIRNGRHWGQGRPLLPPMPWFNYREMTDEDLAAVFAYTRTLTPIHNRVPQPLPPPGAATVVDAGF
jgi:mono/diheme cytochrome c family protein